MKIMVETNDGFKVAEKDLEIRGPGDMEGTRQSGLLEFKLASIVKDREMLEIIRMEVEKILSDDPSLQLAAHLPVLKHLRLHKGKTTWSKIS